jgi:AraC-like DNA-binding protein
VIAPHGHPWHQLIYSTTGVMTVTAEQGLWVVPPHWAIWAPAGIRHGIQFTGASVFATLCLRPSASTNGFSASRVADNPSAALGSAAVARRFGLGLRTLERLFDAETGMTFGRWRREARFLHGLRSLAQGVPVTRVSAETGYRSASAFVAAFKARFRTTPGRYFGAYPGE